MLVIIFITLIKCLKDQKSCGSLFDVVEVVDANVNVNVNVNVVVDVNVNVVVNVDVIVIVDVDVDVNIGSVGHIITLNEYPKDHKFLGWLSCSAFQQ